MLWQQSGNKYYNLYGNKLLTLTESYISKANGKVRKIFIANKLTKKFYRSLLPELYEIYNEVNIIKTLSHGFLKNKSSLTNALAHKDLNIQQYNMTISVDIKDFFPSITPKHVPFLSEKLLELCFINEQLPQGLPTSPIISNLAMVEIDTILTENLDLIGLENMFEYVYTRYVDDITISIRYHNGADILKLHRKNSKHILNMIEGVLICNNFKLNNKKTKYNRFHDAVNITGVNIYNGKLSPNRKTKKKFRAAIHQKNIDSILGLINWMEDIIHEEI